ncbi:XRE family transcriptional regulator [Thalassococcus profundi]|uniref:XRE family transcriptional regulator n=1 Tax=Thalassococcus profundi TaxID=2282382 RepID=A0A369TPW2_9RHOB|nr:helix-turn-helix transcriptional regulator [Thalassococcus profundi]RDD66902.1 XRE family transcriptional regulator [Thalassococcus profundi]
MSVIDELLGRSISERRRQIGMSQAELAAGLKITQRKIAAFENGTDRATAQQIFEIADLLDVDVTEFFDKADAPDAAGCARDIPDWAGVESVVGHYDVLSKAHRAAIFAFLLALTPDRKENF